MRSSLLSASLLLLAAHAAHADTLQTLYLYATFQTADTVSGTLIYDLNEHFIIGANVTSTGLYNTTWTSAYSTPDSHGSSSIEVYNQSASPYLGLNFAIQYTGFGLPVPFTPITICSITNPCKDEETDVFGGTTYSLLDPQIGANDIAVSGYITPIAPTPEPSGLALLATGTLALTAVLRKRFFGSPRTEMAGGPPIF